jgi:two-component system response regulator
MASTRILVVNPKTGVRTGLPAGALEGEHDSVAAEVSASIQDAILKLSESGYDAVVCWAEQQDQLAGLIRIRKARPSLPILLLTPQADDAFHMLARALGATLVLRPEGDAARTAALVRTAITSGELAKEHVSQATEARRRVRELRQLTQENRALAEVARNRLRRPDRLTFIPLIVEGEAEAAFRMVHALQRADVFSPLPVLKSREEAVAFLNRLLATEARGTQILPTILLVDAGLPDDGAIAVLQHVRSTPALAPLPVILLGSSTAPVNAMGRAYASGANSWVERPSDPVALVQCLSNLKSYWGSFNQGPGLF